MAGFEESLRQAAIAAYGEARAAELKGKLAEVGRWLELVDGEPLDLLDEEPDTNGD
ncbi:MAG TPA: hypothetical protein VK009_20275 [Chloroflexota bacterium]|nr:hypothetical protein [Chloroflexota bacterium]